MTSRQLLQPVMVFMLCGTFSVVACTRDEPSTAVLVETPAVEDDRLETYVQARYQDDPQMRTHDIDVAAESSVVTLRGTVPTAEARAQAATLAQQVNGVRSVDNQLEARTDGDATHASAAKAAAHDAAGRAANDQRSPGWITTKIQAQYFVDPRSSPGIST